MPYALCSMRGSVCLTSNPLRQDILKEKRAEYGEQIIATLSQQLVAEFGAGFTARNLANMIRFAEVFQDEKILYTLCAKLSWSHFRLIIYLDDDLKRDFYAEMCRIERWSREQEVTNLTSRIATSNYGGNRSQFAASSNEAIAG